MTIMIILLWNICMGIISINKVFHTSFQKNSQMVLITTLENQTLQKIGSIIMFLFQEMRSNIIFFPWNRRCISIFLYPISNFWKGILSFFLASDRRNINITNSAFNSPKRSNVDRNDILIFKGIRRKWTWTMYTYTKTSHTGYIWISFT